ELAVLPMGIAEFDPLTGRRCVPEDHRVLRHEATFRQTLGIIAKLQANRVVLTHIEEPDGLSYDSLHVIAQRLNGDGLPVSFAHDTLKLDV
ncbi:MAG: hypothetical protein PVJ43_13705, partial [Gemmatimonadales bacterium]